jgi:hypothetical protein
VPGNTAGKAGNKAVFRREYGIPGVTCPGSFCSIVEYEKMPSSLGLWSQVFHGNVGIRKAPFLLLPSDQHTHCCLKGQIYKFSILKDSLSLNSRERRTN